MAGILAMFLTKSEMERIRFLEDGTVVVDVHQLDRKAMKRLLRNIAAVFRNGIDLLVIHGYHHGTTLKDVLQTDRIFSRPYSVESNHWNPGRTRIHISQ